MPLVARVLEPDPIATLDEYRRHGGGAAQAGMRSMTRDAVIDIVTHAGIRGRGGAGFPTGRKWQTIAANASPIAGSSIVVNAAEGEPGSFKDREILRRNPYRVLEGAIAAAYAVGATKLFVGMKRLAAPEIRRVRDALAEVEAAGWLDGIEWAVIEGPPEYLLGEETGLLEVIDGRAPFPRVDPPYRRGADEIVEHADDVTSHSSSVAHVELASSTTGTIAPPALVDNVETLAHVALALANGVDWFRALGTDTSPGSVVCTVSGATPRAGVGEVEMGTTLREAIELIGGSLPAGRSIGAVLQGVSAAVLTPDQLDTPLTWEAMEAIGSGLGAAAFIVFDDRTDPVAIAAAVSRFLAVESCGQCAACKADGLLISDALERMVAGVALPNDVDALRARLVTVADGARCSLATQHQVVVGSLVETWPVAFDARRHRTTAKLPAAAVLPIHSLDNGTAVLDVHQLDKQSDWTFDKHGSGQWPADRLDEHRAHEPHL